MGFNIEFNIYFVCIYAHGNISINNYNINNIRYLYICAYI